MSTDWQLNTPIVFLIFNRPDTTAKVFAEIAKARPKKLFVVADGPRSSNSEDIEKCATTRAVIDQIDWRCEVFTDYADTNVGLAERVSSGLSWVFEHVDSAIVLEDDCLPDCTFFQYCDVLLDKYRDDQRIMAISGDNFQLDHNRSQASYYYSRYPHCWGWATWRSAWKHYDHTMALWPQCRDDDWLRDILLRPAAIQYWKQIFQRTYDGEINSWAYRWTLSCWLQSGLSILPAVNLVSNIGFNENATNTKKTSQLSQLEAKGLDFPLISPPFVVRNSVADDFTERTLYSKNAMSTMAINRLRRLKRAVIGSLG